MKRVILVVLLAAAVSSMAVAQCREHEGQGPMAGRHEMRGGMDCHGQKDMGQGQWWENPMVVKELDISEKQAEQIDQLSLSHRKNIIKLKADLEIAELEFRDLMEGDPSEADVRKKAKAISQLREKLQDLRIDHMLAVRKVLTPDQEKKLRGLKKSMRHRRMMMEHGRGQGLPNPPNQPQAPMAPK